MPDSKLRAAIGLARSGRRRQARELFLQIVDEDQYNEAAWLWLAGLVDDVEDQIVALENALVINPDNHKARAFLERLQRREKAAAPPPAPPTAGSEADEGKGARPSAGPTKLTPTRKAPDEAEETSANRLMATGLWHEQHGRMEEAVAFYKQAQALGETQRQRQRAAKRLKAVERRLELRQPVPVHTTFTLLRLSLGPFFLYLLLTFIHAAFRPWRVSPLLCVGGVIVLAGSLLLVGARITTRHPWWRQIFDGRQLRGGVRTGLAWLGFTLLLLPFILFFLSAYGRLTP